MQRSLVPEASCPGTTRQGDRIREPISPTCDAYQRPKSQSSTVYHTETEPWSGHYGRTLLQSILFADRNRTPQARVSLHIQNPKPRVRIKNRIEKIHKLFDVTMEYTKDWGRVVAMAMLPPPPTKPITLPWQCGFSWGGKKEEYAKPRTKGTGMPYGKIGLTTVAVTQDLPSGMPLVLKENNSSAFGIVYYLNQDNPVPNCPNSYASLHARRPCMQ